jgi:hypothetical protein
MANPPIVAPADIDAAWLTEVLALGGIDAEVRSFTAKAVGTGQIGDSVRFKLEYARPVAGAPASLVGKFPSSGEQSRATGITLGNYMREVNFYKHLAPSAQINVPRCWFSDIDPATHAFVLMLEDLAPAEQGDQLVGVSLETARLVLEQAALLHASHWGDATLDDLPWVQGSRHAASPVGKEMVAGVWRGFCDRYGARVTPLAKKIGEAMADSYGWQDERTGPKCLTHNDFRPDNMMFASAAGGYPVTTLDWQTAGWAYGATDVAYFLGGAIPPEVRREHEAALLDEYLAHLRRLGVTGYTRADLTADYAAGTFQLFLTAFFAAMVVTQTPRGDDMFFVMLNGAAAQIEDTGALSLLP